MRKLRVAVEFRSTPTRFLVTATNESSATIITATIAWYLLLFAFAQMQTMAGGVIVLVLVGIAHGLPQITHPGGRDIGRVQALLQFQRGALGQRLDQQGAKLQTVFGRHETFDLPFQQGLNGFGDVQHTGQRHGGHHPRIRARRGADLHATLQQRLVDRPIGARRMDVHPAQAAVGQHQVVTGLQLGVHLVLGRGTGDFTRDEHRVDVAPLRGHRRLDRHEFDVRALGMVRDTRPELVQHLLGQHQPPWRVHVQTHSARAPDSRTMVRHLSCSRWVN